MKLVTALESWAFRPSSALPLGLCRVLFFGWLFCWYLAFDFSAIAFYPAEIWRPMTVLKVAQLDFIPTPDALLVVQSIWKVSLLLAGLGLFTRASTVVAFLLGTYLLALTHSFSKINHSDGLLVVAMGVFAFSRCRDALSLDRLISRRKDVFASFASPSGEYTWPFQAIRLAVVLLFFGSGISKLLVGGWRWMFSDNLYNIVAFCQITRDVPLHLDLQAIWFYQLLAVGTVLVELAAPLALFNRIARAALIPALLGMQIGIRLVMGDNFTQFMAVYLFWVPWLPLIHAWHRARLNRPAQPSVLSQPFRPAKHS